MRGVTLLCLLLVLAACAAPGRGIDEQSAPPMQAKPSLEPALAPELASSVLLALWNADAHRHEIRLVDPDTGQAVPSYAPISLGGDSLFASLSVVSDNGERLAAIESRGQSCESSAGGTSCWASADVLHLIDVHTWRPVTGTFPVKGWVGPLAFSPDAARLALVHHQRDSRSLRPSDMLMLFDANTGESISQRALDFRPSLMEYTRDGTLLALYGTPLGSLPGITQPDSPHVLLVDAATLEIAWEQSLADVTSGDWCLENCTASHEERLFASWTPDTVLSPDGRKLYIVHADEDRLTTVDLDARTVHSVEIRVARSWFEELLASTADVAYAKGAAQGAFKAAVLSPDGTRLYVIGHTTNSSRDAQGQWQMTQESLGLQMIDVASGHILSRQESEATQIRITPDGAHLLLSGWAEKAPRRWTEVLDADSLQSIARLSKWEVVAMRRIGGQPVVLASESGEQRTQLAMLDARSFDVVHSWSIDARARWVSAP